MRPQFGYAFDEAGALRRAVGCAYQVLHERDPAGQRRLVAADTLALLDATLVRCLLPDADGGWRSDGGEALALPAPAERMQQALLERVLAERRGLVSSHPRLDRSLAALAQACADAGVTVQLLPVRADERVICVFAVHWLGRPRPAQELMSGFYYFFETVEVALALTDERQRIEAEQQRLRRRAFWDELTGLPNKQALDDELHAHALTRPFAVLALDFDGMREANAAFGYEDGGDVLIRLVGQALSGLAGADEFAARLHTAGDEFCLLLPGADAAQAERRRGEIEEALDGLTVPQTHRDLYHGASVGCATRADGESAGQTLGRAIEAMRVRKLQRRGG